MPATAFGALQVVETAEIAEASPSLYNLGTQLATEEAASAFTEAGELAPEAVAGAEQIIPAGELGNPNILAGFAKYSTDTYASPSGAIQVHFYMDPVSGEVFHGLDYKTVFNGGAIAPYVPGASFTSGGAK